MVVLLLFLELKSIYQDRDEHQAEFDTTLAGMKNLMSEATGGNSYVYFGITQPMPPNEIAVPGITTGYISVNTYPLFVGEFPLHDVVVAPTCPGVGSQPYSMERCSLMKLGDRAKQYICSFRLQFQKRT